MSLPNQLSLLRLILAPVFLYLFVSESNSDRQIALAVFVVAVLTDWYDGLHARKYGQVSKTGIFLDPLADKFLTSAAFVAFYLMGIMPLWMVILIVVRDIAMTLLRSYEEYKGKTLKTTFAAKTKTFIQMTYIFAIVFLVAIRSFTTNLQTVNSIDNFLRSDVNYYLALLVTVITFLTGISYFVDLLKSPGKALENS
jgi:CDP-diacylglycerol--glycerol-3-phosphate 3-phosphatidyltransferase